MPIFYSDGSLTDMGRVTIIKMIIVIFLIFSYVLSLIFCH
jgi:hypothetical protein